MKKLEQKQQNEKQQKQRAVRKQLGEAVPGLRRDCPSGGEKDLRKMCRQTQENRGALVYALWKKAAGGGAVLSGMSGEGKDLCPGAGAI